jgi:RHS repeat-associated protein
VYSGAFQTVALSRTGWLASASSSSGSDIPVKALDGDLSSRWSTGTDQVNGQYFQVDMVSPQTFVQISLDSAGNSNDYPRSVQVFASTDGSTWGAPIATGSGTASLVTISVPKTTARFLKIVQTGSGSNWWSIAELNVFGVAAPQPTAVAFARSGWQATASLTCQSDVPGNAVDGNASTRWSTGTAQAAGQWFQVDLGISDVFTRLTVDSASSSGDYMRSFQIFAGDNPSNFGAAIASGNGTASLVDISVTPTRARYIKIVLTGSSSNWWSIHELNVYGVPVSVLPRIGWAASAFRSQGGDVGDRAVDANIGTRWSSGVNQAPGQWFQVDMGVAETISTLILDSGTSTNDYPRQFQLYASTDSANWGPPVATGTGVSSVVTVSFTPKSARYLKIVLTGVGPNWWSIHELSALRFAPVPYLTCVAPRAGGFTAIFGYVNSPDGNQQIQPGPSNQLTIDGLAPQTAVQPQWFGPSNSVAFAADFSDQVSWQLGGSGITAYSNSFPCQSQQTAQGLRITLPDGTTKLVSFDPGSGIVATDTVAPGITVGKTEGSFAVSADGAATYHVDFWVPAGRAGFQPALGISYNSRTGTGPLGVGWSLDGVSQITRCGKRTDIDGFSRGVNYDTLDSYCLDGKRLLLKAGTGADGSEYMESETSFAKVIQHGDGQTNTTFEVRRKDGKIFFYGGTTATLRTSRNGVMADDIWSLAQVRDRTFNVINYTYTNTDREIGSPLTGPIVDAGIEHLLSRIDYVYRDLQLHTPSRSVVINYISRKSPEVVLVGGQTHILFSLISSIEMVGPDPVAAGTLKSYAFQYQFSPTTGKQLLQSVSECNGSPPVQGTPSATVCKRPTTFLYSDDQAGRWVREDLGVTDVGTALRSDEQVVDLNGDGLDDVIYTRSTNPHRVTINDGQLVITALLWDTHFMARLSNGFDLSTEIDLSATGAMPTYTQKPRIAFFTADLDSDGKTDVVAPSPSSVNQNGLGPLSYFAFRNTTSSTPFAQPTFMQDANKLLDWHQDIGDSRPYLADINGDGLIDAVSATHDGIGNKDLWTVLKASAGGHTYQALTPAQTPISFSNVPFPPAFAMRMAQRTGADLIVHGDFSAGTAGNALSLRMDSPSLNSVSVVDSRLPTFAAFLSADFANLGYVFVDINGDGLPEAMSVPVLGAHLQDGVYQPCPIDNPECSTPPAPFMTNFRPNVGNTYYGRDFPSGLTFSHITGGLGAFAMDVDQDGREDLVLDSEADRSSFASTDKYRANVSVARSTGYGFAIPVGLFDASGQPLRGSYLETVPSANEVNSNRHPESRHYAKRIDINGDGLGDIIVGPTVYRRDGKRADLLTGIVDGAAHDTIVHYRAITDTNANSPDGTAFYSQTHTCAFPAICVSRGVWAVSEVDVDDGTVDRPGNPASCPTCGKTPTDAYNKFFYSYADAASSLVGDGWLGFGSRSVYDARTSSTTTTTYDNVFHTTSNRFPKRMLPATETVRTPLPAHDTAAFPNTAAIDVRTLTRHYKLIKPIASAPEIIGVVPEEVIDDEQELVAGVATSIHHSDTLFAYDTVGLTDTGGFGNETSRITAYSEGEFVEHDTTYYPPTDDYLVSLVKDVTDKSTPTNGDPTATRMTTHDYYDTGLLKSETIEPTSADESVFLKRTFKRDFFGAVYELDETDLLGKTPRTSTTKFDSDDVFPTLMTNAVGHPTQYAYHPGFGVLEYQVDPNGATVITKYDRFGRAKSTAQADGSSSLTVYSNPRSNSAAYDEMTTGSDGHIDGTTYDRLGRAIDHLTLNMSGDLTHAGITYDAFGNIQTKTVPSLEGQPPTAVTHFEYDARNRLTRINRVDTDLNTRPVETLKFYKGREVTTLDPVAVDVTDGTGRAAHKLTNDELGRCKQSVDYRTAARTTAVTTAFTYGAFGDVRTTETDGTDAEGGLTTFTYDTRGRRSSVTDPDSGLTSFAVDPWSNTVTLTDPNHTTQIVYDAINRVTSEISSTEGTSITIWDSAKHGLGKRATATSAPGLGGTYENYTYDPIGREIGETHGVGGAEYTLGFGFETQGAFVGKLNKVTYPAVPGQTTPFSVEYRYSTMSGDLVAIGAPGAETETYWKVASRDASGRVTDERFADGLTERTLGYDDVFGTLTSAHATTGASVIQNLTLTYDANDNLIARGDTATSTSETFGYDRLGRLRTWTSFNGGYSVAYGYDDLGNRKSRQTTHGGISDPAEIFTYGENGHPHQLTTGPGSTSYHYDPNGDETGAPGATLTYGAFHLPLTMTLAGHQTSFEYDAVHQRSRKRSALTSTTYVGGFYERRSDTDGVHHVMHLVVDNRRIGEFVIEEAAPTAAPAEHYLLDDQVGSPVVVLDGNGQVIARPRYEPFGARLATGDTVNAGFSGDPAVTLGFSSHEHDDELGLIDMGGRIYDPGTARFLAPDVAVSMPLSTQSQNRYTYVRNNPLSHTDPSGFEEDGGDDNSSEDFGAGASGDLEPGTTGADSDGVDVDLGSSSDTPSGGGVRDAVGASSINSANALGSLAGTSDLTANRSVPTLSRTSSGIAPDPAGVAAIQRLIDSARDYEALGLKLEGWQYRQAAIDKAIEVYGIETALTNSIKYDPFLSEVGRYDRGDVRIGPQAFNSPGYLGSSIAHEAEVHGHQYFEEREARYGTGGRFLNEAEAYQYEVINAQRFGLNPYEVRELNKSALSNAWDAAHSGYSQQVATGTYTTKPADLQPKAYYTPHVNY